MYESETLMDDLIQIETSGTHQWRKAYRAHPAISLKIDFRISSITNIYHNLHFTHYLLY